MQENQKQRKKRGARDQNLVRGIFTQDQNPVRGIKSPENHAGPTSNKLVPLPRPIHGQSTANFTAKFLPVAATSKNHFMNEKPFTDPVIKQTKKEWYIEFYYLNPFNGVSWDRIRLRGNINNKKYFMHNPPYRQTLAEILLARVREALLCGRRPNRYARVVTTDPAYFGDDIQVNGHGTAIMAGPAIPMPLPPDGAAVIAPAGPGSIPLIGALEKMCKSESLGKSKDTQNAFNLYIGRLKKFLAHIKADRLEGHHGKVLRAGLMLNEFTAEHAAEFKDFLTEEMELSNATVNCTIVPIKRFFERYVVTDKIPKNPFRDVRYNAKRRGSTFIPLGENEKNLISAHLKTHAPELYLFTRLIYSCYIRPKEICGLLPTDFDLKKGMVMVRGEDAKTANTSHRQLMGDLSEVLEKSGLLAGPKTRGIFHAICGEENTLRIRRRRVTALWDKIVKKTLLIDKDMYALKHTGNIDYLLSLKNVNDQHLTWLMNQNNHSNLATTQHYIRDLGIMKMEHANANFGTY